MRSLIGKAVNSIQRTIIKQHDQRNIDKAPLKVVYFTTGSSLISQNKLKPNSEKQNALNKISPDKLITCSKSLSNGFFSKSIHNINKQIAEFAKCIKHVQNNGMTNENKENLRNINNKLNDMIQNKINTVKANSDIYNQLKALSRAKSEIQQEINTILR